MSSTSDDTARNSSRDSQSSERTRSTSRSRSRDESLNTPGRVEGPRIRLPKIDSETFGNFAESFARFMGTPSFLLWMTLIIIFWLIWNSVGPPNLRFDQYPFVFLTLMLSLQASYAAPLILLAQNRQEARDRIQVEGDRKQAAQSRADMDYLAREIASVRLNVGELATRDYVRNELSKDIREAVSDELRKDLTEIMANLKDSDKPDPPATSSTG